MNEEKEEVDINKKNKEDFEKLMEESSTNKDAYWDSNNPIVKIVLLLIGVIIIIGVAYVIIKYMGQ